jgi:hypothetical protein
MKTTCLSFALVALGTSTAWAGSICPARSGAHPIPYGPDAAATGCNVVITINADRSATVTVTDPTPYEFSEDVLVGVLNNSSSSVPSIALSGSGIFDLESDGICTFTFAGSSCGAQTAHQREFEHQSMVLMSAATEAKGRLEFLSRPPGIPRSSAREMPLGPAQSPLQSDSLQ